MTPLPVDSVLPDLVTALSDRGRAVLEAPPGAGKTTRVPSALWSSGLTADREVIVLEPRRLAARLAARRVASEHGEKPGELVGWQVRFEDLSSPRTRIRFVTEGVLTRKFLTDPTLSRVGAVVLDEFHERHLQGDLALALLRALTLGARPDLKLVVMSATLDGGPIAKFLGHPEAPAPTVRSEGRRYDVSIEHLSRADDRPLSVQVASAVSSLVSRGLDGDVLVFLPGAAEIRRAMAACAELSRKNDLVLLALHGELSPSEQDRAVVRDPAGRRKVVLSTNVAETSVTLDGVAAVIDSGLARVASQVPWSGLSTLRTQKVSKSSAIQRAGRAGRTRAGVCLRLYTRHDFDLRAEFDVPEVQRVDLAQTLLELHAMGVRDPGEFQWFEPPLPTSVATAEALLRDLDAIGARGELTATGRAMLGLAVHPRLSRVVVESARRGVLDAGCTAAALLSERRKNTSHLSLSSDSRGAGVQWPKRESVLHGDSDVTSQIAYIEAVLSAGNGSGGGSEDVIEGGDVGLDRATVSAIARARRQIVSSARGLAQGVARPVGVEREEALRMALLSGYPDRVARRVRGAELALVTGGVTRLDPGSEVQRAGFLIAVEAEERLEGPQRGAIVKTASAIEPEWLLELFPHAITEAVEGRWRDDGERAEAVLRLYYRGMLLDEGRAPEGDEADRVVSTVLRREALAKGSGYFGGESLERWVARVSFVAKCFPEAEIDVPTEGALDGVLSQLCASRRSFAELREALEGDGFGCSLTAVQKALVARAAPEKVSLEGGRAVKVHWQRAQAPWIESRLQDFFGMTEGPRVASGRVPLVLHLLAPNHRAVQVTTDLAGFWTRHYPAIRRELCRRYPRHTWPDDGATATAPAPRPARSDDKKPK